MPKFDAEISWTDSARFVRCNCLHYEKSHRPISRKCSLCDCQAFVPQDKALIPGSKATK